MCMRAWIVVWAMWFAGVAYAEGEFRPSEVPPLLVGESSPSEILNYFDARELGSSAAIAYVACRETSRTAFPEFDEEQADRFCDCFADTMRANVRAGRDRALLPAQGQRCYDQRPLAAASRPSVSTASIVANYQRCIGDHGSEVPAAYVEALCGCAIDAWIAGLSTPRSAEADVVRCDAVVTYIARTGRAPTRRQFAGIRVLGSEHARQRRYSDVELPASPTSSGFIPYEGNGRGPTLCTDGQWSHSSGRGTCSHHGGVAGSRKHRRK